MLRQGKDDGRYEKVGNESSDQEDGVEIQL
jgi:hypothetical protein